MERCLIADMNSNSPVYPEELIVAILTVRQAVITLLFRPASKACLLPGP